MQADFSYCETLSGDRAEVAVSIFAQDRAERARLKAEAELSGNRIAFCGGLSLADRLEEHALGEVVLAECHEASGAALAMLSWLDEAVFRSGGSLVVLTCSDALDDVFACLDQSAAAILVDAGPGERAIALGRALGGNSLSRVRDLSDEDRLSLIRLTEQVEQIARRLDTIGLQGSAADGGAFRFESPSDEFHGEEDVGKDLIRKPKPPLPDPRLVRHLIALRNMRGEYFDAGLFADPAWDILLDLTAARAEHKRVSVTSLCIAANVPPTTGLRWIGQMVKAGLLNRVEDEIDRRRAFIELSDSAAEAMARYFVALGKSAEFSL